MSDAEFTELVATSETHAEALRRLGLRTAGGNVRTLKQRVQEMGLDVEHFSLGRPKAQGRSKSSALLETVLIEGSSYSRAHLKKRLLREGLLQNTCSKCGQDGIWQGHPLVMVLDHVNGVPDDHRIGNLRMLCPNCNSQQPTFAGRNNRGKGKPPSCEKCGKQIGSGAVRCKRCVDKTRNRKVVQRPPTGTLQAQVAELGYCGTARLYGVSDNAVRKWLK